MALYVKGFPPRETGGPVEVASRLARELLRDPGCRLSLIVQTDSSPEEIRSVLDPRGTVDILKLPYYPSLEDLRTLGRVHDILRRSALIHFNEFPFRHLTYLGLARLQGVPLVFSLHGRLSEEAPSFLGASYPIHFLGGRGDFEIRLPGFAVSALVWVYRRTNRVWSAIVVNSRATLRSATEADGIDPSRAHVIPNGVDLPNVSPEPPTPHDGPPRVVFVGKLEAVKGPDLLFDALEELAARGRALEVTLAGAGSLEAPLRSRVPSLRRHQIRLLGSIHHETALQLMSGADGVVVPSRYESFPLVVLEAMAMARPIIATNVGGIPEILRPGENAFLAEPRPEAFASALEAFMDRQEAWRPMGLRNAAAVRKYGWDATASQYESLYRSLLAPPPRPARD